MQAITHNETRLWQKSLRLGTSASLAVCITGLLLLLMCSLIATEPPEIIENNIHITEVVMPDDRKIIEQTEPPPVKPVEPVSPPDMPEIIENFDNMETLNIAMGPPPGNGEIDLNSGVTSGSAMPIFKVAPQYPSRLQARGVEGYVDLMFDIGPTGKTQNIRVLYSQPNGLFDQASIKALKKWKYKPAVDDGIATLQKNQTTRISFHIEN